MDEEFKGKIKEQIDKTAVEIRETKNIILKSKYSLNKKYEEMKALKKVLYGTKITPPKKKTESEQGTEERAV